MKNEPINHVEAKSILGGAKNVTIRTYFYDKRSYVCCLETVIAAKKSKTGEYVYSILSESLWEKPIATVKSKKYLTDFTGMKHCISPCFRLLCRNYSFQAADVATLIIKICADCSILRSAKNAFCLHMIDGLIFHNI